MIDRAPRPSLITSDGCRCAACGRVFASPRSFARHRVNTSTGRRCRTDAELRAAGIGWVADSASQNSSERSDRS